MIDGMTGNNTAAAAGGGEFSASWQGLAQIPQLLNEVRAGVLTLRSLISMPSAAVATGSPPASAAIVALGAELVVFLAETVQAIDDDIDGLRQVQESYQQTERDVEAAAVAGGGVLAQLPPPPSPSLNGGVQSCTARATLAAASLADDAARGASWAVRTAGNASQSVLGAGETVVRGAYGAAADVVDGIPLVGDDLAAAYRQVAMAGGGLLDGIGDAVEGAEDAVEGVADRIAAVGDRAEDLLTLQGSCSTGAPR